MTDKQYESVMRFVFTLLKMYKDETDPEKKDRLWAEIEQNFKQIVENP